MSMKTAVSTAASAVGTAASTIGGVFKSGKDPLHGGGISGNASTASVASPGLEDLESEDDIDVVVDAPAESQVRVNLKWVRSPISCN